MPLDLKTFPWPVFTLVILLSIEGFLNADSLTVQLPESIAQKTQALNQEFLLFPPVEKISNSKSPLLIFLHGGGGGRKPLERFKTEFVALQVQERRLPLTVVVPQRIQNPDVEGGWLPNDLDALLNYLIAQHDIDPDRVYLTGMSMGGAGTWFWAHHSPELFAAIVPIAAGGQTGPKDPLLVSPESFRNLPVWAFHGNEDQVCPHGQIARLVERIKAVGGPVEFTLYDGVGHGNILQRVYCDDGLYEWLMKQSRLNR